MNENANLYAMILVALVSDGYFTWAQLETSLNYARACNRRGWCKEDYDPQRGWEIN